jgi:hypothetical protein
MPPAACAVHFFSLGLFRVPVWTALMVELAWGGRKNFGALFLHDCSIPYWQTISSGFA